MEQPDPFGVHPVGRNGISCPPWPVLSGDTAAGALHDGGMRELHTPRPVPEGFGLDYAMAVGAGMAVAAVMLGFFAKFLRSVRASGVQTPAEV